MQSEEGATPKDLADAISRCLDERDTEILRNPDGLVSAIEDAFGEEKPPELEMLAGGAGVRALAPFADEADGHDATIKGLQLAAIEATRALSSSGLPKSTARRVANQLMLGIARHKRPLSEGRTSQSGETQTAKPTPHGQMSRTIARQKDKPASISKWLLKSKGVRQLLGRKHATLTVVIVCGVGVLVAALLFGFIPNRQRTKGTVTGTWGTCPWQLDADGLLVVGAGEGSGGWSQSIYDNLDRVIAIRFDEGVVLPKSTSFLFEAFENVRRIDASGCDTSKVEDMSNMFTDCPSLKELDVSGWDTSRVEDMGWMFEGCSSLEELDVSGWDTSRVEHMRWMFEGCSSLAELDVSGWDTSRVEDMYGMFCFCSSLGALDISGWDTSKVASMSWMFGWDSSLEKIAVGTHFVMTDPDGKVREYFEFPDSTAQNHKWYSNRTKTWYSPAQIVARSGIADTYTAEIPKG